MKLLEENTILKDDEIQINVQSFMNLNIWSFVAKKYNTIYCLKVALEPFADASHHEMKIIIGPDYPYPLADGFHLHDLLENHRTLTVIIVENPSKAVPKRVLEYISESNTKILNLMNIEEIDINYLQNWVFLPYNATWSWESIKLWWNHPLFCNIMDRITTTLESMIGVLGRVTFPTRIYINGEGEMDNARLKSLRYFYKKLEMNKLFHTIELYISQGLLGNNTSDYMILSKETSKHIDLILSSYIWDTVQYDHKTLCLIKN